MTQYAPTIDLTALNGADGVKIFGGSPALSVTGISVAAVGDVNGDGIDDLIIGAPPFFGPSTGVPGGTYVVFGHAGPFDATFDLGALDGTNGFRIGAQVEGDLAGINVAGAGDINGDGYADLIIGAPNSILGGDTNGSTYVVLGHAGPFAADLQLDDLDGSNGFRLDGAADDFLGLRLASAGDINGDGFDDLIVAAPGTGVSYVILGSDGGFAAVMDPSFLDGVTGFQITTGLSAILSGIESELSVSSAGDVNGDGFDDLIVGVANDSPHHADEAGSAYVLFGHAGPFAPSFDVSCVDGTNGFKLSGVAAADFTGVSVSSAGDINGDGLDDLIVGALGVTTSQDAAGAAYVVFGRTGTFGANINLGTLNGHNGFRISGVEQAGAFGWSVASAGDVNGDGFADIIIGAPYEQGDVQAGRSYVVFGKAGGFDADIDVSTLDGDNGYAILGGDLFVSGYSVSAAGDINNDGFDDLIVGAPLAGYLEVDELTDPLGAAFVIFGSAPGEAVTRRGTDENNTIHGGAFGDHLFGQAGDDILLGGGGSDYLIGGTGADAMTGGDGNDTYYVDDVGDTVIEEAGGGVDTVITSIDFDLTGLEVENLKGQGGADLVLTGNGLNNKIAGGSGDDTIDAGEGNNRLNGGLGADTLSGGAARDVFVYAAAADSTGAGFDLIVGFNAARDRIDAPSAVTGIDARIGAGAVSAATFDSDLASVVGAAQLGANHAVVFHADGGDEAGHDFLIIDLNGVDGYQAGQDLVIALADQDLSRLTIDNFI